MSLKYIARYPFNDSGNLLTETVGDYQITIETGSTLSIEDTSYGTVLQLDGTTSLISSSVLTGVTGDNTRSFTFWANVGTFEAPIFSYGTLVSPDAFVLYAGDSSGAITFSDFSSDTLSTIITPIDVWRFYAITYDSGNMKIYIDGVLSDTIVTTTLTTGTDDSFRIGTDGAGSYLEGYLSDFRIYDVEIAPDVVSYMYTQGPNHQEIPGFDFIESMTTLGTGVHGTVLCRDIYGIQEKGAESVSSLFAKDINENIVESARFTHSEESIKASVRHTNTSGVSYMTSVVESTPEKTSFFVTDSDDTRRSVVFSSDGVKIISESPYGMYFGDSKDFRIVFQSGTEDSIMIQALDSSTGDYITKWEVGSS